MSVDWYAWDRESDAITLADHGAFYEGDRTVARTTLAPFPGVTMDVSTVFLSLDHRFEMDKGEPLVFETMIFGGPLDQEQWRWSTPAGARAGHEEAVRLCRSLRFRLRCAWWLLRGKPERW